MVGTDASQRPELPWEWLGRAPSDRTESLVERLRRETKYERVTRFLADPTPQLDAIEELQGYLLGRGAKTEVQVEKVTKEVEELRAKIHSLEKERVRIPWLYIVLLCAVVAGTGALVVYGWAEKPEVSIEYNVGEIIGGALAGVAALIASLAYALRGRG